jgi:glyoxylase-like metal-dependent hydrolase (beta-lactamase superfamily II)
MAIHIFSIPMGFDRSYIIKGEGTIMVDCGEPKKVNHFIQGIKKASIKPEEVQLIVITHGHWDHIGSTKEVKEITGAKIAMHQREKDWLEKSLKPQPPGVTPWGRIFINILKIFLPLIRIPATTVDVVLTDGEFSLAEYGIPGKVLYTPGHSSGSVSVLL